MNGRRRERAGGAVVRVLITRPLDRVAPLDERLRQRGLVTVVCPLVELRPTGPATVDLGAYDWVVVTSRTAAEQLALRRRGEWPRVAAIGPGTASALRAGGVEPATVASVSTQEGLLDALPRAAGRVLFAGAEGARRLLADELGAEFVPLYTTVELRPQSLPRADLVVLASPSAARAYGATGAAVPAATIGPETSSAARRAGVRVLAEAATHDVDGLVAAVERAVATLSAR